MIRNYITSFAFVMLASFMNAQQDPQFTQWFMDPVVSNIAAAGQSNLTNISAIYRQQWASMDGRPETTLLNFDTRFGEGPVGLGGQVYQETIGNENNTMIKIGPSFTFNPNSSGTKISGGIGFTFLNKKIGDNYAWFPPDGQESISSDPAIPNGVTSGLTFDLDFGLFIRNSDKYYAGISSTSLIQSAFTDFGITRTRHYYIMGGYNYSISGDALVLRTNFLTKTDLAATAIDFNINALINDMFWAGLSYRPGDAIAPVLGYQLRMEKQEQITASEQFLRIGYSYDITTSELQTYSAGSHEIFLSYGFMFKTTPILNKYANPRFL